MAKGVRIEHDLLGEKEIPEDAYYGIQTVRALENFQISGVPIRHYPDFVRALGMVKLAAVRANHECGVIDEAIFKAVEKTCEELIEGRLHDHFLLDVFQGGAGTSTNMNANEVIANRALEHLGKSKGEYTFCDPLEHINRSQSTNDVYPSALHLGIALANTRLIQELRMLVSEFRLKGNAFKHILKMGRTQLQDAVPMTVGQEFLAWARSLEDEAGSLEMAERYLLEVNMGGTAIGTGLNAPPGYGEACVRHLTEIMKKPIRLAPDLVEATQDTQAFVLYSSALKSLAIKLSKVCNDLRLLSSGPRAGLYELLLPAMQPGSTIMPGKVNPVIPEVVNQVCYKVIGNDMTVTMAAEAGQLQLNVMAPVMASCILESQTLFINVSRTLRERCVSGIVANEARCREYVEKSIGVVTALNPVLGYDASTQLAAEALKTGRGIVELIREKRLLTEEQINKLLDPKSMTGSRPSRHP